MTHTFVNLWRKNCLNLPPFKKDIFVYPFVKIQCLFQLSKDRVERHNGVSMDRRSRLLMVQDHKPNMIISESLLLLWITRLCQLFWKLWWKKNIFHYFPLNDRICTAIEDQYTLLGVHNCKKRSNYFIFYKELKQENTRETLVMEILIICVVLCRYVVTFNWFYW